jgi:hypothetical protein
MTEEPERDGSESFLDGPLFKPSTHPSVSLEVYAPEWRAGAQAIGYREAAKTLIDVILAGDPPTSRTLLHPLLFLYRHAVELRLKQLIAEYGTEDARLGHELIGLWRVCRKIVEPYSNSTDMDKAERIITELSAVDPKGQAFRYARSSKGHPIEIGFDEVDLVHLRKLMDDLDTLFFDLDVTIDESRRDSREF